jgi:hypothetical protein
MLPEFDEYGRLPPGIHDATWTEIVTRYGTSAHRRDLLEGILDALRSLKTAGCRVAYLDGSFVTAKEHPEDFDARWDATGVVLERLDPELQDFSDKCAAQKTRYGGELYPADWTAEPGGIRFRDYFQRDAITKQLKGIIAIDVTRLA